jgi:hypothetical protein
MQHLLAIVTAQVQVPHVEDAGALVMRIVRPTRFALQTPAGGAAA